MKKTQTLMIYNLEGVKYIVKIPHELDLEEIYMDLEEQVYVDGFHTHSMGREQGYGS